MTARCTCNEASSPLATEPASVRCPVDHANATQLIELAMYADAPTLVDTAQQLSIWNRRDNNFLALGSALRDADHTKIGLLISEALAERIETLARQKHADDCSESTHRAAMRGYPVSGDEE